MSTIVTLEIEEEKKHSVRYKALPNETAMTVYVPKEYLPRLPSGPRWPSKIQLTIEAAS